MNKEAIEKLNWKTISDSEYYIKTIHSHISENKLKIKAKHSFFTDINVYNFSNFSGNISLEMLLKNNKSKTLLTHGDPEQGGILSKEDANKLAQLIPKCSIRSWQNTGHVIHNEHPQEYRQMLIEFLDQIS